MYYDNVLDPEWWMIGVFSSVEDLWVDSFISDEGQCLTDNDDEEDPDFLLLPAIHKNLVYRLNKEL